MIRRTVFLRATSLLCLLSVIFVSADISSFESASIKLIEEYGQKIPEDCFLTDPIFTQKKDRATNQIKYQLPNDREFEYASSANHTNKGVIVFTSEEDELIFKKKKRVYVVLKKNPMPTNNKMHPEYFAATAYVRDAGANDPNPIDIDGGKYKIEWDLWDEHLVPGGSSLSLKSLFCSSTIVVPCLSPDEPIRAGVNGIVKAPKHYVPKKSYTHETKDTNAAQYVVAGGDPEDSYDLYRDLEGTRNMEGRAVAGPADGGLSSSLTPEHKAALCTSLGGCAAGRRKKRSGEFSSALDFPGWKTQYIKAVKGSYAEAHEELPFFGLGNCPFKPWKPSDLDQLKDPEAIIDFYLTVLRTECVLLKKAQLLKLLEFGLINLKQEDKTFHFNPEYRKMTNPKLNFHEYTLAATASGMVLFSQTFVQLTKNPIEKPENPDGRRITRTVNSYIDFILRMVKLTRDMVRLHMVAGTRHGIVLSWMGFSKIAQDMQNIENSCNDCDADLAMNYNDRVAAMALLQFLKYGLHDVDTKGADPHDAYIEFYKKNIKVIELRVNIFS